MRHAHTDETPQTINFNTLAALLTSCTKRIHIMEFVISNLSNYVTALNYFVENTTYHFNSDDDAQLLDFSLENYDAQDEKEIRSIIKKFNGKELD